MTGKVLDLDKRWAIIALNNEGKTPLYISNKLNISRGSVYNYIDKYKKTSNVEPLPRSGRPRVSTEREDRQLIQMSRTDPTLSLNQMVGFWNVGSRQTISNRLLDHGLESKKMQEKPLLSKKTQMTRLKWCKERENWSFAKWSSVTFSDESNFTLLNRKTTPFVRRFKHEKYQSRFCKKNT